jgi:hypothetical protein
MAVFAAICARLPESVEFIRNGLTLGGLDLDVRQTGSFLHVGYGFLFGLRSHQIKDSST